MLGTVGALASEQKEVSVHQHLGSGAQWFNFFHGTSRRNLKNLLRTGLHPAFGGGRTPPHLDMMQEHLREQSKALGKRLRAAGLEAKAGGGAGEPSMSGDAYVGGLQRSVSPQFHFKLGAATAVRRPRAGLRGHARPDAQEGRLRRRLQLPRR